MGGEEGRSRLYAFSTYFSITPLTSAGSSQLTSTLEPFTLPTLEGGSTLCGTVQEIIGERDTWRSKAGERERQSKGEERNEIVRIQLGRRESVCQAKEKQHTHSSLLIDTVNHI